MIVAIGQNADQQGREPGQPTRTVGEDLLVMVPHVRDHVQPVPRVRGDRVVQRRIEGRLEPRCRVIGLAGTEPDAGLEARRRHRAGNVDVNWTWVGFGAGMAALLAAVMGVLYLSRHRDRVALP